MDQLRLKHISFQMHMAKFCKIKYNQHGRNKLADDSCPCTALDSPFETKDKQWVKNCVDDRSDQSADHRISGTAVSTNQVVAADGQGEEWKSDRNNAYIIDCVRHHIICCAKKDKQWFQKD